MEGRAKTMQEVENKKSKKNSHWAREEIAQKIVEFEKAAQSLRSQRQLVEELEIPRSTLQHWLKRKNSIDAEPELIANLKVSCWCSLSPSASPGGTPCDDTAWALWHSASVLVSKTNRS